MGEVVNIYLKKIKELGYICPNPMVWDEFFNSFCKNHQDLKPLILGAWHHTTDYEKIKRFELQLMALENEKALNNAIFYLDKLIDSDWYKG
jgi:hypothetical protein